MKKTIIAMIVGCCVLAVGPIADAALDWRIEWNNASSPQTARVYIFNPERTLQTFSLEAGDVAKITDDDQLSPQLIVGQDIHISLNPGERRIFDMLVYQDIDARQISTKGGGQTYLLSQESYHVLNQYNDPSSRQYPVTIRAITPVEREGAKGNQYVYRSGRGYWMISLADHNHVAEQLIRTGNRMGALHASIQQAILFYTQGNVQLTTEALKVWRAAFPELAPQAIATPTPSCPTFVTFVASNTTQYSSSRKLAIGDVLSPKDRTSATVVMAEDLAYSVPANGQATKSVKTFLMSRTAVPTSQTQYDSITKHDGQSERAIRIGFAENYSCDAIQDVVYYINRQVSTPTTGRLLWERLNKGSNSGCTRSTCFQPCVKSQTQYSALMNLGLVVGAVLPMGLIVRRKRRN
ncbi:hypothetical protein U14_03239 [Candidatus Moduliflexus flocculans]|uniref:Uncharacterized protein n=1 Tax=Candidatus Moduliflexus flocculans TaxID=1499966 RepID=A0A081BNM7_9BACT|nr:hypothetical protein U14_03239 [Candidatus Moduliflexus flocculans]